MLRMWGLRELSIGELVTRTVRNSWQDEVFGQSGRLAFYFFFSMFPLVLLLVLLSKGTAIGAEWQNSLLRAIAQVLPADAASMVISTIRELDTTPMAGAGLVFAGLGALWGTVNGTWAIMAGLNNAYEIAEQRSFWQVLAVACALTACLCTLSVLALVLLAGADGFAVWITPEQITREGDANLARLPRRDCVRGTQLLHSVLTKTRLNPAFRHRARNMKIPMREGTLKRYCIEG
jgi:uncharacterized BrkB/YihY/UPF0761 family membrane protein